MQLSVIIPALNEEKTITVMLDRVLAQKEIAEVIVIDDGSVDNTANVVKAYIDKLPESKKHLLKVLTHKKNLGKGAAIRTGLAKAKGNFIIIQDADLEYNPREYKKLIDKSSKDTVVYGSRLLIDNPRAYIRTYLGNALISRICNLLFQTKLTDIYSCYKLLPEKIAKKLNLTSNGFEIEAEITAKLSKRKIPIVEVPITYNPRSYKEGKKIKAKDALIGTLTLLKVKLGQTPTYKEQ